MFKELIKENDKKILLLVMDGVGGLPIDGKTTLESAITPNLDKLAKKSSLGFIDMVSCGITPGSAPGHLSLFGYDPIEHQVGRGILECLGLDMEVKKGDLAIRGNFATLKNGIITDRRAGRISTERNKELLSKLIDKIKNIEDVEIILKSGKEHRFAAIFRGKGLSDELSDADPQESGNPPIEAKPLDSKAEKSARLINKFISIATDILKGETDGNTLLIRGFALYPDITPFDKRYKLNSSAIAVYPMYRGLAKLVGMSIISTGESIQDEIDTLKKNIDRYNFFFVHIKKTDSFGEDGNFEAKKGVIEEVDKFIPAIMEMGFDVICITGDHSTPATMSAHSWHPVPVLINSKYAFEDDGSRFTERECVKGILGHFKAKELMVLLLANALKLKKFGA